MSRVMNSSRCIGIAMLVLFLGTLNGAYPSEVGGALNTGSSCKKVLAFFALQTTTVDGETGCTAAIQLSLSDGGDLSRPEACTAMPRMALQVMMLHTSERARKNISST